jgi:hypothetical protein
MVSQCKICGTRTRGHRQYCPNCRPWKGRKKPLVDKVTRGMIANSIPFIPLILGIYLLNTKRIIGGIISVLISLVLIYHIFSSKKLRDKFMEREMR